VRAKPPLENSERDAKNFRLALGEKLQAQDRNVEAVDNYQKLLAESPDYPGSSFILNTVAALQKKIADTNAPTKL